MLIEVKVAWGWQAPQHSVNTGFTLLIYNFHLHSEHIDRSVGHVITGNVGIVSNKKLSDLFKKGYYIESTFKNKNEIKSLKRILMIILILKFPIS